MRVTIAPKRVRRLAAWLAAASAGVCAPPGAGQPAADDSLVRIDTATFAEIAVVGSSVLERDELEALTGRYENRPISFEALQALRQELSSLYIERGYVTSGVLIPDQTANGRVVLQAVEGELTSVVVEGNRRLREGAIERRATYYLNTPLNVADLQRGLRSLQNDPLIERINAELEPGAEHPEARFHHAEQPERTESNPVRRDEHAERPRVEGRGDVVEEAGFVGHR